SVSIGNSVEGTRKEMKQDGNRVRGTIEMPPQEVFRGEKFSFVASADAVIMTASTRITGPADPIARSDSASLADAPIGFPDGVENASREGSKFLKTYRALIRKPLADVIAFYREEFAAKGWPWPNSIDAGDVGRFKNDALEI